MVERLEAAAEAGAEYYMVTVSESVTFSYPALATDAEAAREKVAALIEAGRVRAPLDLVGAPCRREGIEVVDAVESEDLSCRQVCAQTLMPGEAERLVDDVEAGTKWCREEGGLPEPVGWTCDPVPGHPRPFCRFRP